MKNQKMKRTNLFELLGHIFSGGLGGSLGFDGSSGSLLCLLDGGFLGDLGSAERERIGSQVLSEFGLGLVTGHETNGLILALMRRETEFRFDSNTTRDAS